MTVKITEIENGDKTKVLRVEGKLTDGDAKTLERAVSKVDRYKPVSVDLAGVTFIDREAVSLIERLKREGIELTGIDFFIKAIIDAHSNK